MTKQSDLKTCLLFLIILCLLTGCYLFEPKPIADDPKYAPVPPSALVAPPVHNGSLYREGYGLSLFEDNTARRIGDILTIVLDESTKANAHADTSLGKSPDVDIGVGTASTLLGSALQFNTPGALPLASNSDNNLGFRWKDSINFEGDSDTNQNHKLTGRLTVTVSEVLPNGNLVVRGEKWVNINQGENFIRLIGIVRPEDIASDNTVLSTRVADARISYGGTGAVSDSNVAGWLTRFFVTAAWPF